MCHMNLAFVTLILPEQAILTCRAKETKSELLLHCFKFSSVAYCCQKGGFSDFPLEMHHVQTQPKDSSS
jgi:hypothetical protein